MMTPHNNLWANRHRIVWTVSILVLFFARVAQGDTATLVGSGCVLDLQLHDIEEHVFVVEAKRGDIARLEVAAPGPELYSDRLFIRNCTDEFEAKLISMSKDSVILRLPRYMVATLEVGLMPGTAGDAPRSHDVESAALHQAEVTPLAREREVLKARTTGKGTPPTNVGNAEFGSLRGRMLANGKPYAGINVKLRRLDTESWDFFARKKRPQLFDTITDGQGFYRFEQLPEGSYDIYWIPPGRDHWVRLLKKGPAVVIHAGAVLIQPDINADMKIL